jgi:HSP20 family molecular chaperone IbpA
MTDEIDCDGIEAVVKDGVLRVVLPKVRQSENTRKVTVRRSE